MKNRTPPLTKSLVPPKESPPDVANGTRWLCEACGEVILGIWQDNVLQVKHRRLYLSIEQGMVQIRCRKCSYVNSLDMRHMAYKVDVIISDSLVEEVKVEVGDAEVKRPKKRGRRKKSTSL